MPKLHNLKRFCPFQWLILTAIRPFQRSFAGQKKDHKHFILITGKITGTVENYQHKTYPADCRKIAAVDSNKQDWD